MSATCLRNDGSERKWFRSEKAAEAFERDPANTIYHGDVAHLCG
jgi:hypothetical protein